MRQNTRKLNNAIDAILPHANLSFEQSLALAIQKVQQNEVISTWMDAWELKKVNADIRQYVEVPKEGCLTDVQQVAMTMPIEVVKRRIWSLGGDQGWYAMNWAWRLRGLMDQMLGGTGLNRGRRHPTQIDIGDSIDFWRVLLADEEKGHLILFAEMKLPGEAWLEFDIDGKAGCLTQTATFRPRGFLGRIYWYLMWPFHVFIFRKMATSLAQDGKSPAAEDR